MTRSPAKRMNFVLPLVTIVLLVICLLAPAQASADQGAPAEAPKPMFIENVGQFAPQARFLLTTTQGSVWVADDGMWLVTAQRATPSADEMKLPLLQRERALRGRPIKASAIRFSFNGPKLGGKLEPFGRLDTQISYLHGRDPSAWKTSVPAWSGVRVKDLYPGVDLVLDRDAAGKVP